MRTTETNVVFAVTSDFNTIYEARTCLMHKHMCLCHSHDVFMWAITASVTFSGFIYANMCMNNHVNRTPQKQSMCMDTRVLVFVNHVHVCQICCSETPKMIRQQNTMHTTQVPFKADLQGSIFELPWIGFWPTTFSLLGLYESSIKLSYRGSSAGWVQITLKVDIQHLNLIHWGNPTCMYMYINNQPNCFFTITAIVVTWLSPDIYMYIILIRNHIGDHVSMSWVWI